MLDLSPELENTVREFAQKEGLSANDYLARLLKVAPEKQVPPKPKSATAALFEKWDAEDANMTDEERREEDQFWDDFTNGINEDRAAQGMRKLF